MRPSDILSLEKVLKIPVYRKASSRAARPGRRSKPVAPRTSYQVKAGDSVWLIARNHNTTVRAIMRLNRMKSTQLQVGQDLWIPSAGDGFRLLAGTRRYRVQLGDSPYKIAQDHNMKLERFLRINRLTPRSRIYPGQELLVDDQ